MLHTILSDKLLIGFSIALALLALALLAYYFFVRYPKLSIYTEILSVFSLGVFVLYLRLQLSRDYQLNVDEADWIVAANTLFIDPRYMVSTIFPIFVTWPIVIIKLLKNNIDFSVIKIFGTCNLIACIVLLYYSFKNIFRTGIELLILIPYTVFIAMMYYWDFIAYNSEYNPNLMFALAVFFYSLRYHDKFVRYAYPLLGFSLGCFLHSKIQVAPVAGIFALIIAATLAYGKQLKYLLFFSISLAIPSIIILGMAWSNGALDVYYSVLIVSIGYASKGLGNHSFLSWPDKLDILFNQINEITELKYFITCYSALVFSSSMVYILNMRQLSRSNRCFFAAILACTLFLYEYNIFQSLLISSISVAIMLYYDDFIRKTYSEILFLALACTSTALYVALLPPTHFTHYLIIFITPYCFLCSTIFLVVLKSLPKNNESLAIGSKALLLVSAIFIFLQVGLTYNTRNFVAYSNYSPSVKNHAIDQEIASEISKYVNKYDRVAVWGWASKYQVMTQTTSATRIVFSFPLLRRNSPDDRWVNLYYADMVRNKPVVIVDAITPTQFGYELLKDFPIETVPRIKQYVDENYTQVSMIDGVRIFASNTRLLERGKGSKLPI